MSLLQCYRSQRRMFGPPLAAQSGGQASNSGRRQVVTGPLSLLAALKQINRLISRASGRAERSMDPPLLLQGGSQHVCCCCSMTFRVHAWRSEGWGGRKIKQTAFSGSEWKKQVQTESLKIFPSNPLMSFPSSEAF